MDILAIDLGTQSIRAALVDKNGVIRGIARRVQTMDTPCAGWAEQSPETWWKLCREAVREVVEGTGSSPEKIAAVSTCGQMHGPVGVDRDGSITTPMVQLWCDKRCEDQCALIRARFDEMELSSITGNPVTSGWVGLKVRWIREHRQDVYRRTQWFLVPKDFINYRLTGAAATDPSEASGTYLWDAEKDGYSEDMARRLEVDLGKFAPVIPSHAVIGKVSPRASRETGILEGTPVIAGGGDFPVSLLGMGIAGEGGAADITGTSTLFVVHRTRPIVQPGIQNLRHVLDGWIPFFMLDCGGISMKWCRDLFSTEMNEPHTYEELIARAAEGPPGCDGLLFYPYLMGERRGDNTAARGSFAGITIDHGAPHFIRAVMEGTALAMGMNLKQFRNRGVIVNRVYAAGGGTRNRLWNQIKADVLGAPYVISPESETSLRGAGLLGAYGAGMIDLPSLMSAGISPSTIINPVPEAGKIYETLLERFEKYYRHMLGFKL